MPANTPANAPATTNGNLNYPTISVPQGVLRTIVPIFPSGVNETTYVKILYNGQPIFPTQSNVSGWFTTSDTVTLKMVLSIPLNGNINNIDLTAYNTDTTNAHLIGFMLEVVVE